MALRTTSLSALYRLARRDPRFFNALLRNPRKAIEAKGMRLPLKDLKKLERSLKQKYRISGQQLAKILISGKARVIVPWPHALALPFIRPPWP